MIDFVILRNINPETKGFSKRISLTREYTLKCDNTDTYLEHENSKLIIIGDCINIKDFDIKGDGINELINNLKGNFYAFLVQGELMYITSSAFGLLPVYYIEDYSCFSSSVELIEKNTENILTKNKKWIVNQYLFNYQFGADTIYSEIKLFPGMSYLRCGQDRYHFIKYYSVEKEFVDNPKSWAKALEPLSNLFIKNANNYISDTSTIISFTGGFDGRTLVSIATHLNKNFTTFSYGKKKNDDVHIPLKNSKKLNIPYFWLDLGQEYADNEFSQSAKNYIESTCGGNGYLYAHVDYSARMLKGRSEFLLSGICGSELFRAAHTAGAVTSQALIDLFTNDEFELFKESIYKSHSLQFISKKILKDSIDEVIEEAWSYKLNLNSKLDKNQKLYVFVYEEIFRKFFGAWVKAQMRYIKIRTPYIDFDFFKELIKTELSGAYSDFLTENPLKRFKGQVLYAEIIKKTNTKLYLTKTGKGYAPIMVRVPILRPFLLIPFLVKRLGRKVKSTNLDNLGIISGIKKQHLGCQNKYLEQNNFNDKILNLNEFTLESLRDSILMTYATDYYINKKVDDHE